MQQESAVMNSRKAVWHMMVAAQSLYATPLAADLLSTAAVLYSQ
jgi:hypothetical protein